MKNLKYAARAMRVVAVFGWAAAFAPFNSAQVVTDTSRQRLTAGGAPLDAGEAERRGLIAVTTIRPDGSAVTCSGVLLSNVWALTAGHCIDSIQGSQSFVTATYAIGTFPANAIYKFGGWAGDPNGPDIGLLRLNAPVPVNGSTNGLSTRLYARNAAGKTVTVYGASTGAYLKADMKVSTASGRNLILNASIDGVTTAPGDSGGPAFVVEGGQAFLVGLTSTSGPPTTSAAVAPHRSWIIAATRAFMAQTDSFASTVVLPEEVRSVPEGALLPNGAFVLVGTPWARAQRVVQWMCTQRGFIGGTFVSGLGGSSDQYRIACIGRTGGMFRDATQQEIDDTGWGFSDPDTAPWAQAARAAAGVCPTWLPGTVGGMLTGFRAMPVGSPDQRMGVLCLHATSASFGDMAAASLTTAGRDLNLVEWLGVRQDVSNACREFGPVGGFSNGHQSPTMRGVVCIGRTSLERGTPFGRPSDPIDKVPKSTTITNPVRKPPTPNGGQ